MPSGGERDAPQASHAPRQAKIFAQGLHRFRGEFDLHKVCTAAFLAHVLHTFFFPPLPKNSQKVLANIAYACILKGNEYTTRGNHGKW